MGLNCKKRTLSYKINGIDYGIAVARIALQYLLVDVKINPQLHYCLIRNSTDFIAYLHMTLPLALNHFQVYLSLNAIKEPQTHAL